MGALVESRTLEAEIADCCQAIYSATEPDIAMANWARLRELRTLKSEADNRLFTLETHNRGFENPAG
jgi:hypothetical protein